MVHADRRGGRTDMSQSDVACHNYVNTPEDEQKFRETRSAFQAPFVREAAGHVVISLSVCRSH